jgi:hypothetical protein
VSPDLGDGRTRRLVGHTALIARLPPIDML